MKLLFLHGWKSTPGGLKQNTIILHSRADETVPFADSEELVRNGGLPSSALIEVGTEHRLADDKSLGKMVRAVGGGTQAHDD